ncbi:hypothetical protein DFH08DRAFT_833511 [Mycena albidolilacea]|uniref:Secreted protein n=1 Tax=Mycena albidolilacea TaxID=1033008 RepID=A0AAD7AQJ0_9AGAR|nr:hypothetical protein DFH08DRAFT_833511 [Mycena albidolilacea]
MFTNRLPAICLPLALVVIAAWRRVLSEYGSVTATRELDSFGQTERCFTSKTTSEFLFILIQGNILRADFMAINSAAKLGCAL